MQSKDSANSYQALPLMKLGFYPLFRKQVKSSKRGLIDILFFRIMQMVLN